MPSALAWVLCPIPHQPEPEAQGNSHLEPGGSGRAQWSLRRPQGRGRGCQGFRVVALSQARRFSALHILPSPLEIIRILHWASKIPYPDPGIKGGSSVKTHPVANKRDGEGRKSPPRMPCGTRAGGSLDAADTGKGVIGSAKGVVENRNKNQLIICKFEILAYRGPSKIS